MVNGIKDDVICYLKNFSLLMFLSSFVLSLNDREAQLLAQMEEFKKQAG